MADARPVARIVHIARLALMGYGAASGGREGFPKPDVHPVSRLSTACRQWGRWCGRGDASTRESSPSNIRVT
ncbi:hypothetical protein SBD_1671 [Streptomyces bottropensis ATCC 25435]|uniref:Uncharacterized protein n=1 Tax=Streptomyces bottropensis ATCC 25435 TaxID=1054862 RepID=M3FV38_9ACTN|nr:hypothetical protein SBD_1671 [Streptomyces bottropensis ATCC 25435]